VWAASGMSKVALAMSGCSLCISGVEALLARLHFHWFAVVLGQG